jgi:hypothetical protein
MFDLESVGELDELDPQLTAATVVHAMMRRQPTAASFMPAPPSDVRVVTVVQNVAQDITLSSRAVGHDRLA